MSETPPPVPQPQPGPQRIAYISFADVIDDKRAKGLMQICSELSREADVLYLMLSSPGGGVDLGITLYNFLRALPCFIVTHNIGSVESIANIVFLAGELRLAAPHTRFLLHGIFWQPPAGATLIPSQMAEAGTRFRDDETRIKEILLSRTTMKSDQVDGFFRFGESKTAEFAKDVGIISNVSEPKIRRGSPFFSCNFI